MQFITKTEVQSQSGSHFPIVLCENSIGISQPVHIRVVHLAEQCVVGIAEQELNKGIVDGYAGIGTAVEIELSHSQVAENVVVVVGHTAKIAAELKGVFLFSPGDIVENLNDLAALLGRVCTACWLKTGDRKIRHLSGVRKPDTRRQDQS